MTLCKKICNKLIADKSFYFIFLPAAFFLFIVAFLLLMYPQAAFNGVTKGIDICLETVIPSLFPFLVISAVTYDLGIFSFFSSKAERLMRFIFNLPSVAFPVILMSLLGGFPVGATLIEKSYDSGLISRTQAQRMLLFCVNPGPAFVVSTIGYAVIGSAQTGWIIYISVTLSSLIIGILSRFLFEENEDVPLNCSEKTIITTSVLSKTLNNVSKNMLNICVWVVVFSCLGSLAEILPVKRGALISFRMISEVTSGAITACENFTVPVVAAVISFAGLCVHFQIMPCIIKVRLKYKYFISVRILGAALSCVLTLLLLEVFPQYSQVFSMGAKPDSVSHHVSPFFSAFLLLMCGLFIIGDNYIISRKTLKSHMKADEN